MKFDLSGIVASARRFAVLSAAILAGFASHAFTRDEAVALYRASFKDTPPSVQEAGDYVFVILEGSLSDSPDGSLVKLILSGQLAALEGYIGRPTGAELTPFPEGISAGILPLASFRIPQCASCDVDETRYIGKYRHVSAFDAQAIRKAREDAVSGMPVKRSLTEWEGLLKSYMAGIRLFREREGAWLRLGACTALMAPAGGVPYESRSADLAAVESLICSWRDGASRKECDNALQIDPAFSKAQMRLSEIDEGEGDIPRAVSRALKASLLAPSNSRIEALAAKAGDNGAFAEFATLYSQCLESASSFKSGGTVMWTYALNTFGFLEFPRGERAADAGFAEAKRLFHTGGSSLDDVSARIRASLEAAPASAEKWRYYAACCRAGGLLHDALIAYHQALALNPGDETAASDLCLLYQKLGFTKLADGVAWHILAAGRDEAAKAKARSVISANHAAELE